MTREEWRVWRIGRELGESRGLAALGCPSMVALLEIGEAQGLDDEAATRAIARGVILGDTMRRAAQAEWRRGRR